MLEHFEKILSNLALFPILVVLGVEQAFPSVARVYELIPRFR